MERIVHWVLSLSIIDIAKVVLVLFGLRLVIGFRVKFLGKAFGEGVRKLKIPKVGILHAFFTFVSIGLFVFLYTSPIAGLYINDNGESMPTLNGLCTFCVGIWALVNTIASMIMLYTHVKDLDRKG